MNSLETYFANAHPPFKSEEMGHLLMTAYMIIRATMRWIREKNVDSFTAYRDRVVRTDIEGTIVYQMDQPVDIRPYFKKILQRDKVIADHFVVVEENEEFIKIMMHQ